MGGVLSTVAMLTSSTSLAQQAPAAPPGGDTGSGQTITLPTLDVGGRASQSPTGPGDGFVADTSRTATKTDTPILETPQSVSTVTRDQMDAQNARSVNEALRYTSGVQAEERGGTSRYDQATIRGFTGGNAGPDQFLDGLQLRNGAYFATQQIDPFLLERIEVLKGPPSVLYGQASPGGLLAFSSKLPVDQTIRSLQIEGGSDSYIRGTIDLGGRMNQDGTLLFRLPATTFQSDFQDGHTKNERVAIAPAITWRPDNDTSLTVNLRYQYDPQAGSYSALPAIGTVLYNPAKMFSNSFYPGDPSFERFDRTQTAVGYDFTHRFNDTWSVHSQGRYTTVGLNYASVYSTGGLLPGYVTMTRAANASKENFETINLDNSVLGKFDTGPFKHELLAGVGFWNERDKYDYAAGPAPTLNILNPVYNQVIPTPVQFLNYGVTSQDTGVYLQDQISLGGLRILLGGRYDWTFTDTRNHLASSKNFDQNDGAFTFRGGLLYVFDNGIAPYFTYSQSFQPLNQLSYDGTPFKPTRGEMFETGIKYQPAGLNSFMTAALFDITQSNVLTTDPAHFGFSVQAGEIRSRGVELEAHVSITREFNLAAAYTYQDVKYTKDLAGNVNKQPTQTPAHFGSVWADYTVQDGPLSGFGGGVGVRYTGTTNGDLTVPLVTQPYTLVDAQLHYDLGQAISSLQGARLQLTAQNLGDARYVASCYNYAFGCTMGAGRTVIARLSYQW